MNLRKAKQWAEYKAYMVSNVNWFVVSWNRGYMLIDQTSYNRHPGEWEIRYKEQYSSVPKKRLEELKKDYEEIK